MGPPRHIFRGGPLISAQLGARQFRFLVAGTVFYVLWHVTEMALRTPGVTIPYLGYS